LDDCLKPCLESIIKYTNLDQVEVIVVANGCTDGTKAFVESLGPTFKLIWMKNPEGYIKPTNAGIRASRGEFVVLLNNDVVLCPQKKNDWLNMLEKPFIENHKTGITGPNKDIRLAWNNGKTIFRQPYMVFFCAMIRRSIFDKIGILDEGFGLGYEEDIDFCVRLSKAGYLIKQIPTDIHYDLDFDTDSLLHNPNVNREFPIYHKDKITFKDIKMTDHNRKSVITKHPKPKYSIIIPTYNHLDDCLKPCLESIIKYTNLDEVEVIVVANGCTDGTKDYVRGLGHPFKLFWMTDPAGYTKATNEGIKISMGEYVVLLNNDNILLEQPKSEWLRMLEKPYIDNPKTGITGAAKNFHAETSFEFLLFFCVMLKDTIIEKFGLLDEIFNPGYGEDIDYCWKLHKANLDVVQVPNDVKYNRLRDASDHVIHFPIWHKSSQTVHGVPKWTEIVARNEAILLDRYGNKKKKLNIGCGDVLMPGYINIDLYSPAADVKMDARKLEYPDNSIDEISAIHVFEHFSCYEASAILAEWFRVLAPGGKLCLELPDILELCRHFEAANKIDRYTLLNCIYGTTVYDPKVSNPHLFGWYEEIMFDHLGGVGFTNLKRLEPQFTSHWGYNMRVEAEKPSKKIKPKYSIVIPTYNHLDDHLRPCIESVIKYTDMSNVEVIVAANGCTDGTKAYVESLGSSFKLVWFDKALGYVKPTNAGMKLAEGEYVILLNNDTEILDRSWISVLSAPFSNPKVGITGVRKSWRSDIQSEYLLFFCAMIKREVISKIGYLDEEFGIGYHEDADYCKRAADQGYTLVEVPHDITYSDKSPGNDERLFLFPMVHKGGGTFREIYTSNDEEKSPKNALYIKQKHKDPTLEEYEKRSTNHEGISGDIYEHLPTLKKYAQECEHITEFGVRTGNSTWGLFAGLPKIMRSYDKFYCPAVEKVATEASRKGINFTFEARDCLQIEIEPTDLLFIDTKHSYDQLLAELRMHSSKVKKYIIMHDTVTFGHKSQDGEEWDWKFKDNYSKGLVDAINDFLAENKEWRIREIFENCNGLTIIERVSPSKPKVYDCFMFFNELDVLEIRLNELDSVVDKFVLAEARYSHQGKPKPLYFEQNKERFKKFLHKIEHVIVEEFPPTTDTWVREPYQRNQIARGLKDCKDNDIIILSDVDEIPRASVVKQYNTSMGICCLQTRLFYYRLNLETPIKWYKVRIFPYAELKGRNLQYFRGENDYGYKHVFEDAGWHFSFLGDKDHIKDKINNWAHDEFNNDRINNDDNVVKSIENGKDVLGRDLSFSPVQIDETYPKFVRDNLKKFEEKGLIFVPRKAVDIRETFLAYESNLFHEVIGLNSYSVFREDVENKSVLDIGGNVGMFSYLCTTLGAKKIVSFEPIEETYKLLVSNMKQYSNVHPVHVAVSSPGTTEVVLEGGGPVAKLSENGKGSKIKAISLAQALEYFPGDNDVVLKIDCEGSEYDILLKADPRDILRCKTIFAEFHNTLHPNKEYNFSMLREYIEKLGYDCVPIQEHQMGFWMFNPASGAYDTFIPLDPKLINTKNFKFVRKEKAKPKPKVYDCFCFFNELDILEVRLNELDPYVDHFVLCEMNVTHSGKPKPLYFNENKERFRRFWPKIIHVIINECPPTDNAWVREHYQRNFMINSLLQCQEDDIIILSDLDEIPRGSKIQEYKGQKDWMYFEQHQYNYYLNMSVGISKPGPGAYSRITTFGNLKKVNYGLTDLRYQEITESDRIADGGWHFGWMGGAEKIVEKLESYAHQELNKPEFTNAEKIQQNIDSCREALGRDNPPHVPVLVSIDSTYPKFIVENQEKFLQKKWIKSGRVAIVMPYYNDNDMLVSSTMAIVSQTYRDWVLFLVDDGSSPENRASTILGRKKDSRIKIIEKPNGGVSSARNAALDKIKESGGFEYIAYCDSDDVWDENHLASQIKALQEADLVYSEVRHEFTDGSIAYPDGIPNPQEYPGLEFMRRCPFIYISSVVHKAKCLSVGGFDSSLDSIEDWDMWVRIAKAGYKFKKNSDSKITYTVKFSSNMASKRTPEISDRFHKKNNS
jgi:beta-1,4-mannosyl-glycoprotein beta-1,4-N-acetylglucosaminyltransferase